MEGKTVEIMMKEMRGIQPRCLSSLCFCLKDILNTNDKSEPIPHLEDSVRIIMSCLVLTKKMPDGTRISTIEYGQEHCTVQKSCSILLP